MSHGDLRDTPIDDPVVTSYDHAHLLVYLRLLDAAAARADWREAAQSRVSFVGGSHVARHLSVAVR